MKDDQHAPFRQGSWMSVFRFLAALVVLPALNMVLNRLILFTSVPLFMDSIGTAVSAAVFGLPLGLATAVLTNTFGELVAGFPMVHLPFALCGMATAWIVHFLVRRSMFSTPLHFILATLLVAVANSVLGAIIATFVFGGGTGVNIDIIVSGFALALGDIFSAALFARIAVNIVDKAPAVFIAMLALVAVRGRSMESLVSKVPPSPPGLL
jgi:energy-coupling factor transport system substrate-specific component